MLQGQDAIICQNCVQSSHDMLQTVAIGESKSNSPKSQNFILDKTPKQIHAYLDDYIIGQHQAKKTISVAIYNHYKRIESFHNSTNSEVIIEKSNILFVGNTGTGKTLIAKTIAKMLDVPFAIADATTFTQSGYVGEDIESCVTRLLLNCDYNIEKAEKGIIFIDEIDKISRKSDNPSITRDVSGEGVQQSLLKLLEGSDIFVPPQGGRKHPEQPFLKVNTANILFICAGAFEGIERIILKRFNSSKVGFKHKSDQKNITNPLNYVNAIDIKNFGLIPELLGRLPVIVHLNPLTTEALRSILLEPKNAIIKQFRALFDLDGKNLEIEEEVYDFIVEKAMIYQLGARGLRTICESIFNESMYESPSQKTKTVKITLDIAQKRFSENFEA